MFKIKNSINNSCSGDGEGEAKLTVECVSNHVFFYSDVDSDRALALIREIKELDDQLRNERLTRDIPENIEPTPIWLHIQSFGGEAMATLALIDQLQKIKTPIYSIVEGVAASAGGFIALSCKKRFITPSSFIMIHSLISGVFGNYQDIKDHQMISDMVMNTLIDFCSSKTKMSKSEVAEILKRDSWFNAQQALEKGLVDEILN